MIKHITDQEIEQIINNNEKLILVFGKGTNCSVCHAVENRVNTDLLAKFTNLDVYYINIDENPLFRGKHLVFSVPTLMLFDSNREILRESRIINFTQLEKVLNLYFNN